MPPRHLHSPPASPSQFLRRAPFLGPSLKAFEHFTATGPGMSPVALGTACRAGVPRDVSQHVSTMTPRWPASPRSPVSCVRMTRRSRSSSPVAFSSPVTSPVVMLDSPIISFPPAANARNQAAVASSSLPATPTACVVPLAVPSCKSVLSNNSASTTSEQAWRTSQGGGSVLLSSKSNGLNSDASFVLVSQGLDRTPPSPTACGPVSPTSEFRRSSSRIADGHVSVERPSSFIVFPPPPLVTELHQLIPVSSCPEQEHNVSGHAKLGKVRPPPCRDDLEQRVAGCHEDSPQRRGRTGQSPKRPSSKAEHVPPLSPGL